MKNSFIHTYTLLNYLDEHLAEQHKLYKEAEANTNNASGAFYNIVKEENDLHIMLTDWCMECVYIFNGEVYAANMEHDVDINQIRQLFLQVAGRAFDDYISKDSC